MKIFISVDIEGTCGAAHWDETIIGRDGYEEQKKILNREVLTVCQAINDLDETSEITIKDAHDSGRNLDIAIYPANVSIYRGWDGGPLSMMQGINETYDMTMMVGYHSGAGTDASPLAHTMQASKYYEMRLNGSLASEFTINYYTSLYFGVQTKFVSGDKGLCDLISEFNPHINTVYTMEGFGDSVLCDTPEFVNQMIYKEVQRAFTNTSYIDDVLPESFEIEIDFIKAKDAYRASYYPGTLQTGARTIKYSSNDYMEILKFLMFI